MSDPPLQYPVSDRKSCGKGNQEGLPKSTGDPPMSDGTQKASNGPSRDKSTGIETSGVSDTSGELWPGNGDGGSGTDMGSRMRSSGSGINGVDNHDKSVACSISD